MQWSEVTPAVDITFTVKLPSGNAVCYQLNSLNTEVASLHEDMAIDSPSIDTLTR